MKILPVYADLVRGLWVCKSSLLYDDGHASKRDRIVLEFARKESIPTKYVDKLFSEERTRNMILNPLGKRREKLKDYKFIVAADSSFIKRYPRIVKEQENAWSVREATMSDPLATCSTTEQRKAGRPDAARLGHRRPQELGCRRRGRVRRRPAGCGRGLPRCAASEGALRVRGAPEAGRRGSGWSGRRPPPSTGGPTRPSRGRGGAP